MHFIFVCGVLLLKDWIIKINNKVNINTLYVSWINNLKNNTVNSTLL